MDAKEVYNLYRGVYEIYTLTTTFRNKKVKLFDAFPDEHNNCGQYNDKPAGTFIYCNKISAIKVVCRDKKCICFRFIRIVGKRKISALDFYNGYIKNNEDDYKEFVFS